jgi:hypothetical protein
VSKWEHISRKCTMQRKDRMQAALHLQCESGPESGDKTRKLLLHASEPKPPGTTHRREVGAGPACVTL